MSIAMIFATQNKPTRKNGSGDNYMSKNQIITYFTYESISEETGTHGVSTL